MLKYRADIIVGLHLGLGAIFVLEPSLVFYFILSVFLYGLVSVLGIVKRQPAYLFSAYLIGFELMGRMSQSGIPHEFVKYAVTSLLMLEFFQRPRYIPWFILLFVLCLVPGIFLVETSELDEWRKLISLNLSGPLCLSVSVIYFYKRPITIRNVRILLLLVIYPLVTILAYLTIATPDLSEIDFGYQSNFESSIYGPNQMASILGLGILIIGICYLLKIRLFGSSWVALVLVSLFAFRGLLTFSRGGMIAPIILLAVAFLVTLWRTALNKRHFARTIFVSLMVGVIFYLAFSYTNEVTKNALYDRYTGKIRGKQIDIEKLTSGRTKISTWDLKIFRENVYTGVGVGMAKFYRKAVGSKTEIIAHNEFTRLLAEHGLFGAVAILILFLAPLHRFFEAHFFSNKLISLVMAGFCLVFMTHSATRLAAPCFLFGLAFLDLKIFPAPAHLTPISNDIVFGQHALAAR